MDARSDPKDEWFDRPSKRLAIYPLESATSFASRLARLKGAPSLTNWCADVGIGRSDLMAGRSSALARLAHLGNIDLDLLTHHAVMDRGRHGERLLGQDMRAGALSWGQVRASPARGFVMQGAGGGSGLGRGGGHGPAAGDTREIWPHWSFSGAGRGVPALFERRESRGGGSSGRRKTQAVQF